jgi:hypothetical protein
MFQETESPSLIQQDLYFEQNLPYGAKVSQEEFQKFVDNVITPRFPAGLTEFNTNGQKEDTKVITLYVENTLKSEDAIDEIVEAYNEQFQGAAVSQVTNKDDLKVGFSVDEDLIDNDPTPELIRADLFFGRNIAGGGEVTQQQFQDFVDNVVTPRFPAGLTEFDANGQFQNSKGIIIDEKSKVLSLISEDTEQNEAAINEIVEAYTQQFQQESVLQAINEDVTVSFGPTDNLIDNDPTPELIRADLFFGRNIAGGGEVTQQQFQDFVDDVVTPRFPAGLTEFDANGQFQNSTGAIVDEKSKVLSLIFEDTEQNEDYVNDIVKEYIQQFQQESVLTVVDEDIQTDFTADTVKLGIPIENAGFEIPTLEDAIFTSGYSLGESILAWCLTTPIV